MSRTTTELYSGNWRQHFMLETDDGHLVPLIASDPRVDPTRAQVFKLDSTWKAQGGALKVDIPSAAFSRRSVSTEPSARAHLPQDIMTKMAPPYAYTASGLPRCGPLALDVAAIMRNNFPEHASPYPRSPRDADKKEYCTYWIRNGECDYMQQGCRYKHEMPDQTTLRSIGFRHIPDWYRERMNRRPLRTHPDVLQSILNRNANDSSSETGSDDSEASLAEGPRRQAVAPGMAPEHKATVPAPSTFDLLSFDDEEEQPQLPNAPNTTPEVSSYALVRTNTPKLSPNRQGRFIPAGEELPRMSTPPLQPSPASPIVEKKGPRATKAIYAPLARAAPVFNQYFKEQKATKSQDKLQLAKKEGETTGTTVSNIDSDKDAQIAELQAKLAELVVATRTAPRATQFNTSPTALRATLANTPPTAPRAAFVSKVPAPIQTAAVPTVANKNSLLTSKHAEVQAKRPSKSRARSSEQKSTEGASTGKGRRAPTGRPRKVVSTKTVAVAGEKEKVGVIKK